MEVNTRYIALSDDVSEEDFELSICKDRNFTRKVKDIDFGPIKPGEEKSRWVWIKNTGQVSMPEVCVGMGIIDNDGWKSRTDGYLEGPLEVGEKNKVAFRLKVQPDAKLGEYTGEIPVTVYGSDNSPLRA